MYIKLLVITATLILLAALTSKSHAGVEGEIDTQSAYLDFRLPMSITATTLQMNDGKFTEGYLNYGDRLVLVEFTIGWDVSYVGVRWVDARISPINNEIATVAGSNPANTIRLHFTPRIRREFVSGDYSVFLNRPDDNALGLTISSDVRQWVTADVYSIKIEGTVWER